MTSREEVAEDVRGMRPREFARKYGLSPTTVYQGIKDGEIPAIRVRNRYVVLAQEFERRSRIGA
jgi:excisionase family DNA binding protein